MPHRIARVHKVAVNMILNRFLYLAKTKNQVLASIESLKPSPLTAHSLSFYHFIAYFQIAFKVEANDMDQGDTLTFRLDTSSAYFSVDETTGI